MQIVLKNVKYVASMSEETHCFSASVYIDGVKAGEVSNRGYGGPNEYSSDELQARLDEHGKTLPPHVSEIKDDDGNPMVLEIDAEIIIGELMNDYLTEKDLKRLLANRIVFTKLNETGTYETKTLNKVQLTNHLNNPDNIKKQIKGLDQILNLLDFDEALKLFKTKNNLN